MTEIVITRPNADSGVGSNLASLAGATWLAGRLGRPLVVDWRGMDQLRDKSLSYWTEFLEEPATIAGVPVAFARDDGLYDSGSVRWLSPYDVPQAVATGVEEKPIGLRNYHGLDRIDPDGDPIEHHALTRAVLGALRPTSRIAARIDAWEAEQFAGSFVVAVNIRSGNGLFAPGSLYFTRNDTSLMRNRERLRANLEQAVADRVAGLPPPLRARRRVFFATDSAWMHDVLAGIDGAMTRRTIFPPPGTAHTFSDFDDPGYTDRDAVEDTLVDMFLLARCDALVYNTTNFHLYARVVTNYFSGNLEHIEEFWNRRHWTRRAKAQLRARLRPKSRVRSAASILRR